MHSFTGEELMRDGVRAAQMVAWPHQSSTRVCCTREIDPLCSTRVCCTREIDPLWLLSDAVWRLMCARHASFHIGGGAPVCEDFVEWLAGDHGLRRMDVSRMKACQQCDGCDRH